MPAKKKSVAKRPRKERKEPTDAERFEEAVQALNDGYDSVHSVCEESYFDINTDLTAYAADKDFSDLRQRLSHLDDIRSSAEEAIDMGNDALKLGTRQVQIQELECLRKLYADLEKQIKALELKLEPLGPRQI